MKRQFYILSESWYADACQYSDGTFNGGCHDEVMFGLYDPKGGTSGEMAMRWYEVGGKVVPRLEAYSDSWENLSKFPNVIAELGKMNDQDITPKQFAKILKKCGFKDATTRTN